MQKNKIIVTLILLFSTLLFNVSCAINPPVQEMSNARQALNAARDANAEQFAENQYKKAKELLEQARSNIENGDYHTARYLALEAKNEAIQARQNSQNQSKENN
ncbi:hypothetical protein MNBD_GAMMA22-2744 [hydrothermal vent metagenome]|uniref:DUF4398 domain-containing protein n=1 Tax=hydrothermal vent metagenome TaxID=652676 RepID=A0A3B0ZTT0_9ZZZZ